MKNLTRICFIISACLMTTFSANAFDEEASERRREEQRDGERSEERSRRDRDAAGERSPRDGDERRERSPKDGDGERRDSRDGDRGGRPPGGGPILALLDTNHDGVLSSEEIAQAIRVLRRADRNRDGKLTHEEIHRPPHDGDRAPGGHVGTGRSQERDARRGGRPGPEQLMARFKEADTDEDGKLSKTEAPEKMKQNFNRIDRNEDGFVDKSEFEAMLRQMREGRGGIRPPREGEGRRPREDGERDGERRRPEVE